MFKNEYRTVLPALCDKMEIEKNIISEFNLQMALWVVKTDELLENYEVIIFIGTRTMNGIGEHEAGFSARDGAAEEGTTVRVEFDDVTTAVDTVGANAVGQSCPHTYGQPLAQFIKATSNVSDAQIISDHPTIRFEVIFSLAFLLLTAEHINKRWLSQYDLVTPSFILM
ncbi:hypothetical protein Tco_0397419 [Tanacetum coccineum]